MLYARYLNKVLRLGNGYERGEDYVSYVVGNIVSPNKFKRSDNTRLFQGLEIYTPIVTNFI